MGITPSPPGSPLLVPVLKRSGGSAHTPGSSIRQQWQHLQPDPGPSMDASRIGYQRLPHHAGQAGEGGMGGMTWLDGQQGVQEAAKPDSPFCQKGS